MNMLPVHSCQSPGRATDERMMFAEIHSGRFLAETLFVDITTHGKPLFFAYGGVIFGDGWVAS